MTERLRIAVAAGKGGVGKTTVATGVASVLAHRGRRTLVVDLDPQSNATWGMGADPTAPGVAELLGGEAVAPLATPDGIQVLPGGPGLRGHDVQRLDPEDLADAVEQIPADAVVFDCPPGLDHLERMGLVAADIALVVLDAHPYAIQGAGRVLADLASRRDRGRRGASRWALVLSRIDTRRALDRELAAALGDTYHDITQLTVRQDVSLATASTARESIMSHAPASRGAEDLQAIVDWMCREAVGHGG